MSLTFILLAKRSRFISTLLCLYLLILSFAVSAGDLTWSAESLPEYDRLFQRTNGWIGADGDFTVTLPDNSTLCLYSDMFIGKVRDGHRQPEKMINNSAARQRGTNLSDISVEFFYRRGSDGGPQSLVTPTDGQGWFWIFGATMVQERLFMFLPQLDHAPGNSAFSFCRIGEWLGTVSNPLAPPAEWQIPQTKIPFEQSRAGDDRCFGSALLVTNGFVYVYGTHGTGHGTKMILA